MTNGKGRILENTSDSLEEDIIVSDKPSHYVNNEHCLVKKPVSKTCSGGAKKPVIINHFHEI